MVFITAGMGGGTGTGAAPVIARVAREIGILTVGVVTKPFHFEGIHRMRLAEAGIEELQKYVDTLIIIPNQNLFRVANERTTFADAFKMADDVLHSGVRGVTDLMVMPGLINLDFADIRTVMGEMGKAMMGTGEAEGERRAIDAAEAAISNPLLEDVSMKGARGVLINITGGARHDAVRGRRGGQPHPRGGRPRSQHHLRLDLRREARRPDAHLGRRHRHRRRPSAEAQRRPLLSLRRRPRRAARRARGYTQPMPDRRTPRQPRGSAPRADAAPPTEAARPPPSRAAAAGPQAAESAALRGGAFIAPRAVDAGRAPAPACRRPRRRRLSRAAAAESRGRRRKRASRAGPSLFERVTGVGRARATAAPSAARPAAAAAPPPRRAPEPAAPRRRSNPSERAGRLEQGGGSARHPGLPAPPGELSDCCARHGRSSARCADMRRRPAARSVINLLA